MKQPREVLDQWMWGVNHGDVDKLMSLYDESSVLIPTFSNRFLNTPQKQLEYFKKLGEREELGITLHEKTLTVQTLGHEIFVLSGLYDWRFKVDGELLHFEARFSYFIDLSKTSPIIHHHSSQIPRMI